MPDLNDTGKRRVYPKLKTYETIDTKELIKRLVFHNGALKPTVIDAAITDMREMMVKLMSAGHKVKIDGLGTFSLALGFAEKGDVEISKAGEKIKETTVGVRTVNFKPSPDLLKDLKIKIGDDFQREISYAWTIKKERYDKQERINRALAMIEDNGFITLSDYAQTNNLSRAAASLELKEIDNDKTSPIMSSGNGTHKVWVKRKKS